MRLNRATLHRLAGATLALLLLLSATACERGAGQSSGDPAQGSASSKATAETRLAEARRDIEAVVARREAAIKAKDREAFLATVDPENTTYLVEQRHWFDDAVQTTDAFSLKVRGVNLAAEGEAQVRLSESFSLTNGEVRSLDYVAVYRERSNGWKDSDYLFKELRRGKLLVMHSGVDQDAEEVAVLESENLAWLKQTFGWEPTSDVVIKLYPNQPAFTYSIKPSLPLGAAGWTEAGESIKYRLDRNSAPEPEFLLHETTHRMLSELTNDNAAYWLQEGLATWAQAAYSGNFHLQQVREVFGGVAPPLGLAELAAINPERAEPRGRAYYPESMMVVKYIVDTYGVDRMKAVFSQLASHPPNEKASSEKLNYAAQLTSQSISEALGVSVQRFEQDWKRWVERELQPH